VNCKYTHATVASVNRIHKQMAFNAWCKRMQMFERSRRVCEYLSQLFLRFSCFILAHSISQKKRKFFLFQARTLLSFLRVFVKAFPALDAKSSFAHLRIIVISDFPHVSFFFLTNLLIDSLALNAGSFGYFLAHPSIMNLIVSNPT
jgi:hypothetical protein